MKAFVCSIYHTRWMRPPRFLEIITVNYDKYARCILACGVGLVVSVQALAQTTFQGPGTNWHTPRFWSAGVPNASTAAIIEAPCEIDEQDAAALSVRIKENITWHVKDPRILTLGDGDDGNESFIESGAKLIIGTNGGPATLRIDGGHKITGDGGVIEMRKSSWIDHESDDTDVLTLDHTYGEDPPDRSCSLVVTGAGRIAVKLFKRAYVGGKVGSVVANIALIDHDKDGGSDGFWIAEGFGSLGAYCYVTGAAEWHVDDLVGGGLIQIGSDLEAVGCVYASGNVSVLSDSSHPISDLPVFVISDGSVFCTTGNLTFESTSADIDPEILAEGDAYAAFGGTCAACQ